MRVFFIPWRSRGKKQWVVTSISHMGEMLDSDWSRPNLLRSDWLQPSVALCTTPFPFKRLPRRLPLHQGWKLHEPPPSI